MTFAAKLLRTRWVVRAPVRLYRLGLGCLFGHRLLMLEHRGRLSGRRRYVVLEVVDRPADDAFVIASGFGTEAQWCRNVLADPHVRVSVGRVRNAEGFAAPLPGDVVESVLERYADRHPQAWKRLRHMLERTLDAPDLHVPMFIVRLGV